MKTIDRLVLKSYLGPMILTFFIVMFVLMMNFLWRYIDDLVGKGLGVDVIGELMLYASINLIPMGLPLATLLAAIMTMGNLGENYELLAMKSAGMSLPRIMRPVFILVFFVSIGSFFVANNLVPYANKQMNNLMYDIRRQKQNLELVDGVFFNGIDENLSIRVSKQDPGTKLLHNVLIYDTRDTRGNMKTSIADSGYIRLSDDKKDLIVELYEGVLYEQTRNHQWYDNSTLTRNYFTEQNMTNSMTGFDFSRSERDMYANNATSQNIVQLQHGIDSLERMSVDASVRTYEPLFDNYLFTLDKTLRVDSLRETTTHVVPVLVYDSIQSLDVYKKKDLWTAAVNKARNSRSMLSFDESSSKSTLDQLYRYKAEWHRKLALPFSIMIFFLIGAPLGAIIRKGGLGMPIVVSVIFFVIYYIISITGEKMAREGTWSSFQGMWISTLVLLPIAIFLTYKATNDSNLFNAELYLARYNRAKAFILRLFKKEKHNNDTAEIQA